MTEQTGFTRRTLARDGTSSYSISAKGIAYVEWRRQRMPEFTSQMDAFGAGWDAAEKRQAEIMSDLREACEAARDWFYARHYSKQGVVAQVDAAIKRARGQS